MITNFLHISFFYYNINFNNLFILIIYEKIIFIYFLMSLFLGLEVKYQTYVPDDAFEEALIDLGYDKLPLDDYVPTENINTITSLNIINKGIQDLTGIQDFKGLLSLSCGNNSISVLNVDNITSLIYLACEFNH